MTMRLEPLAVDAGSLARAAKELRAGAVVAVPTDTVYGLAADLSQPQAVAQLFTLKERPAEVALPVLVDGLEQVSALAGPLDGAAEDLAERYWPGPLTLVVRRRRTFTTDLGGPSSARRTVGIRWPDHGAVRSLCRELGPLAVTSANRHGAPPAATAREVADRFARRRPGADPRRRAVRRDPLHGGRVPRPRSPVPTRGCHPVGRAPRGTEGRA